MGCFFSIFKFGTYVVKESEPQANTNSQVSVPEIRKHSSTPLPESTPKQLQKTSAKPLLAKHPDKSPGAKERKKNVDKEKTLYTTTFETQVDAAPPHPLEEKGQDLPLDQIEIDTNIFTPEVEDAVVKIQAGVRGYLARKHVHDMKEDIANALGNYENEIPVVPPPKNFESQNLNSLNDLEQWKKLSQHLEDKMGDVIEGQTPIEDVVQPTNNGPLTEAVIPLNDSNDNKVIETYVCKENILDVEPTEEQPVFSQVFTHSKTSDERVVDKVFDVLMSETESESIINFVEANKNKIESSVHYSIQSSVVEPIEVNVNTFVDNIDSQESQVLANLNAILDINDTNVESLSENDVKPKEEPPKEESLLQSKVAEVMNSTQEMIRNSFHSFVSEMTKTTESKPKVEESPELKAEEVVVKSEEPVVKEPKVEERKTDSMIFEEEVVQTIFDEELNKNQTKNQIFAIEVFKDDVKEEQLANVTTLSSPEPSIKNIWGVEEKLCKTSIDQFVVKPVEPEIPTLPSEETIVQTLESIPVLETEQKIEVISTQSRKNSEDLLESEVNTIEESLIQTTEEEVVPIPSPMIQIEEQNGNILDEEEAAIRIQAAFRGYQIRRSMSREASPNRTTNHNNIDSNNNNNHNNGPNDNELEFTETAVQWIESSFQQSNNELTPDYNPSEQLFTANEVSIDNTNQVIPTTDEQIDTSLEKLEDQLMQELISSEEEERTQALLNDNLDTTQKLIDGINSGELTAPLLLQRLQQSMSSNASNADPEEQVTEELQISPEILTSVAQTPPEEQINREVESNAVVEDRPLIEKSDTIILDLMSSSPQTKSHPIIDSNQTNVIQSDVSPPQDNHVFEEFKDSEVVNRESNTSPIIVSELLKSDSKSSVELKTSETPQQEIKVSVEEGVRPVSEAGIEKKVTLEEIVDIKEIPKDVPEVSPKDVSEIPIQMTESEGKPSEELKIIDSKIIELKTTEKPEEEVIEDVFETTIQMTEPESMKIKRKSSLRNTDRTEHESRQTVEGEDSPVNESDVEKKVSFDENVDIIPDNPLDVSEELIQVTNELSDPQIVTEPEPEPEIIESLAEATPEPTQTQLSDGKTQVITESSEPQPIEPTEPKPEPTPEILEPLKLESNNVSEPEVLEQIEPEPEKQFEASLEPPTPDEVREVTPELSFIKSSEQAVLTKIYSSESEQEAEVMSSDKLVESRPSMIPVLESNNKPKSGEQTSETVFKRPKPILKEKESKIYTNIIPDEQTHSASEEISSPDDENPEFVGLGPNTPIPVRASSPNPFGKKRRRGKKSTVPRK